MGGVLGDLKECATKILSWYPRWVLKREYESQQWNRFNERPVEYAFVFRKVAELYPRTVLDVGAGTSALAALLRGCGCVVTASDCVSEFWPSGMVNRHYHIMDDDITRTRLQSGYDLITCVSALEHIERADLAMRGMFSLLTAGGHLVATFPYSEREYIRNVYELPGSAYGQDAPYITQSFSRQNIEKWLRESDGRLVEQEYWECWDGPFWTVGNQVIPPRKVEARARHQLSCVHLRKGE